MRRRLRFGVAALPVDGVDCFNWRRISVILASMVASQLVAEERGAKCF